MDRLPFERLVPLEGVHNFRDIGGYQGLDGKRVRTRHLYRSDNLWRLTGDDLTTVVGLGIKTVIDLRTQAELDKSGSFERHGRDDVDFHHISIMDVTWPHMEIPEFDDDADFLRWAYNDMLKECRDKFREALEVIGSSLRNPIVYHCAAGKDRTGLLSMMILGVLGVSHDDIVTDYALTGESIDRFNRWAARANPELASNLARENRNTHHMSSNPRGMELLLTDIENNHGGVLGLVREMGVPQDTIDHLREQMLR